MTQISVVDIPAAPTTSFTFMNLLVIRSKEKYFLTDLRSRILVGLPILLSAEVIPISCNDVCMLHQMSRRRQIPVNCGHCVVLVWRALSVIWYCEENVTFRILFLSLGEKEWGEYPLIWFVTMS